MEKWSASLIVIVDIESLKNKIKKTPTPVNESVEKPLYEAYYLLV